MSLLAYGRGTYRRLAGGLPELRLINMYLEAAATSQDNVVLLSRPGMVAGVAYGDGPIRGIFQRGGLLGGAQFLVSGNSLFTRANIGPIGGAGPVSFAASETELALTAGADIYRSNGLSVSKVAFPDNASVRAVAYLGGFFLAVRDQSQRFYWSAALDATSWDALDYASAESSPDPLLDLVVVGDTVWLLGSQSIELWQLTGATDLPFSRVEGRNIERGVLATGCAAELDNTLFWIGEDRRVYRGSAVPGGISDPGIEERIAGSSTVSTFVYQHSGHKFFCVRLDAETLAYDVSTQEWHQPASYGQSNWRIRCAAANGVFGDALTGQTWTLSDAAYTDGGQPLQRVVTAFQPISGDSATIDNVVLDADFGGTPLLLGQGSQPIVELRASRNGGKTWAPYRPASLGRQGEYRHRSEWRRWGDFDAPGAMLEVRTSEPVNLRISGVRANEFNGGRSR